jgi:hypothetical protein
MKPPTKIEVFTYRIFALPHIMDFNKSEDERIIVKAPYSNIRSVEELDDTSSHTIVVDSNSFQARHSSRWINSEFGKWIAIAIFCGFLVLVMSIIFVTLSKTNKSGDIETTTLLGSIKDPNSFATYVNATGTYVYLPLLIVSNSQSLLLVEQITEGVGLQSLFWDPGNILSQSLVQFEFISDNTSVILKVLNTKYLSLNETLIQRSFATGIVWKGTVLQQVGNDGIWINLQDFLQLSPDIINGNGLANSLQEVYGSQFVYSIDNSLSYLKSISPTNLFHRLYFDFLFTYRWQDPIATSLPTELTNVVASGRFISIVVRRTFLRLQPTDTTDTNDYTPRLYHPKSGFNSLSFMNENANIFSNRQNLFLVRHRLDRYYCGSDSIPQSIAHSTKAEKIPLSKSKSVATDSSPLSFTHILYLIDPLIPEPFRSAIEEGVSWWDDAFQAAGYPSQTFQVQIASPDFDPYDLAPLNFFTSTSNPSQQVRVHFVQWIDRDLRSYSVGLRIIDPRSGEILKGHVRLEGLRMRQDALLAEALLAPYSMDGSLSSMDRDAMLAAILQRTKQLAAHEVGHSLGLAHNFAGSTYNKNGSNTPMYVSVMDYPAPLILLDTNKTKLILNNYSYANGIGLFDKLTIRYGYQLYQNRSTPSNQVKEEWGWLLSLIQDAESQGYVFLTDQDSSLGSSDPRDTKWDITSNPHNAVNAFQDALIIRKMAIENLNLHALHNQSAVSQLLTFVPVVYLWHRYNQWCHINEFLNSPSCCYFLMIDMKSKSLQSCLQVNGLIILSEMIEIIKIYYKHK